MHVPYPRRTCITKPIRLLAYGFPASRLPIPSGTVALLGADTDHSGATASESHGLPFICLIVLNLSLADARRLHEENYRKIHPAG